MLHALHDLRTPSWWPARAPSVAFVAGDRLTLADVLLFAFVDFGFQVGQPVAPECTNLLGWYERMKARPSANPTV